MQGTHGLRPGRDVQIIGVLHEKTYGEGDTVHLEWGPLTITAVARYLDYNSSTTEYVYDTLREKKVSLGIRKNPVFDLSAAARLDKKQCVEVKVSVEDHTISDFEWEIMKLPTVMLMNVKHASRFQEFRVEKTEDPGVYRIYPVLPAAGAVGAEYGDFPCVLELRQEFGGEVWYGNCALDLIFRNNRAWPEKNRVMLTWAAVAAAVLLLALGVVRLFRKHLPDLFDREG